MRVRGVYICLFRPSIKLAVDVAYQRRGIGQDLIRRTHEAAGLETSLVLLSAPNAETYYPHIGMLQHKSCWVTPRQS